MQKVASLNRASHGDDKTKEAAKKLRSETLDKNKCLNTKAQQKGHCPGGDVLTISLPALRSLT